MSDFDPAKERPGSSSQPGKPLTEQWSSRASFVVSAIGSAVGFGNLWRFPYLIHKYGATFLVPYFFALFVFGFPILLLEYSLGQFYQVPQSHHTHTILSMLTLFWLESF
jgi:SNF family Na+-dependent transporter